MITLWDTATGALRTTIEEQNDYFYDIAFSPDNKWIAAASREGNGRIWSTDTGEVEQNISVPEECMLSIVFSPDSRSVVTGSEVLRVWNVGTGDLEHTLLGPGDHSLSFSAVFESYSCPPEIWQVLFSPDGKTLVSTCPETDTVRLWSTESWTLKQTIKGYFASFSPDGAYLAVEVDAATIRIYGTVNWQVQRVIQNGERQLASPTFSPDSKVIATCSGHEIML
jgi:Tol biopolymer transport system component